MSYLEAIADPARLRLVRHLAEQGRSALPELASAAGVHPNTARLHLTKLEEAGLVTTSRERLAQRGRPRTTYRLAPGWTPADDGFRGLAELMSAAVIRTDPGEKELHGLGVEWGRYLLGRPDATDPRTELPRVLEALGFQARVDRDELHLSGCPCPIVAPGRPELVCELTDAVVEGVLTASGSRLQLVRVHHDPERRACSGSIGRAA